MFDIYEEALKKLRADKRTLNELERAIGLPAETIRDIRERITKSPRLDTMKKIVKHYEQQQAA
jgi:DNA-binding Lrp family transcriptional regulator